MRRRQFLGILGTAAAAWPFSAWAQTAEKLPTIGVLGTITASAWVHWIAAFEQQLRELGWIKGRTIAIEYRWAEGRTERFAEIAAEFARRKVAVIFTAGSAVPAVRHAAPDIPIVFILGNDPVGSGLVRSLAKPGGNVTGLAIQATDLAGKRLELLRELIPGLRNVAILTDVGYDAAVREQSEVIAAARTLGLEVVTLEIRRADDIAPAFASLKGRAQAVYVPSGVVPFSNRARIDSLAQAARLPLVTVVPGYAASLICYGPDYTDQFRRGANFVDKILRGAKPAEIPVEQPTKFALTVSVKTAKALGLAIPESFLLRADEVIE